MQRVDRRATAPHELPVSAKVSIQQLCIQKHYLWISLVPRNQAVALGSEVTFRCAAEDADADYDRMSQWRTNSGVLLGYDASAVTAMSGGRYSYQQESSEELHLRITNVSLADDGTFECQMYRRAEGPIRSGVQLNVLGKFYLSVFFAVLCNRCRL